MICLLKDCTCSHHRLLGCIKEGMNDEATIILQDMENPYKLADSLGLTLLHYSAKFSNITIVQYLIDGGCNINAKDTFGITALMLAIKNKDVATVEILLKNNADVYVTDQSGKGSLGLALHCRLCTPVLQKSKSNLMVEMLFDKVNEDFLSNSDKVTQFLLNTNDFVKLAAVVYGNEQLARFVLKNGYNLDYREPTASFTALLCAVAYGRIDNCKVLIEHGANVNATNVYGFSPLDMYTLNLEYFDEQSKVLKSLLKRADKLTLSDQKKLRGLKSLLIFGNKQTVRTVLQSDNEMNVCLNSDRDLLNLLIENKNADVIDVLDELNIEFDVNRVTSDGCTALTSAALSGCLRKVQFLLKHEADINMITTSGLSALLIVAKYCCPKSPGHYSDMVEITELLLQRGADAQFIYNSQSFIDQLSVREETLPTEAIVAHLAMLGALDKSPLTDFTRNRIDHYPWFKSYFNLCTEQLGQMKQVEVYGTVTLFKLLTQRDEKIIAYVRNKELISAFESIMESEPKLESYYSNTLRNRIGYLRHKVECQQRAVSIFELLSGLCSSRYYDIVYQIINYLNLQDLQNLFEAGNVVLTTK